MLFKCTLTVWRDNAKPIWKACNSLFRRHFALEQITSYCSQKAEDYESKLSSEILFPWQEMGDHLLLLKTHDSSLHLQISWCWSKLMHKIFFFKCGQPDHGFVRTSHVTAGCLQKQEECLDLLIVSPVHGSLHYALLYLKFPVCCKVGWIHKSCLCSLYFSQNRSLVIVSMKRV